MAYKTADLLKITSKISKVIQLVIMHVIKLALASD